MMNTLPVQKPLSAAQAKRSSVRERHHEDGVLGKNDWMEQFYEDSSVQMLRQKLRQSGSIRAINISEL